MKFQKGPFHPILFHQDWIKERLSEQNPSRELPTIPEFFAHREIFITGGSGFIGKVLIEKLLRSCPDVKAIYILLRPKKGQTVAERLQSMCNELVFDALRQINPDFKSKIIPIKGDVMEIGIGLSESDRELMENVSIIFHSAASVRFDDSLKEAVLMNTRGTLEILKFAQNLKDIKAIMHVSTTYSNVHMSTIKEEIYPALADWRKTIEICEKLSDDNLNLVTPKYINFMPNTYVFSKNLAEHVSYDFRNKLPIILFRPSVVITAWDEPFGGYVDNFNGPMGILLASHIGINKTMYCDPKNVLDLIPVDVCVKAMIIAAWKRGNESINNELKVINAATSNQIKATMNQIIEIGVSEVCDEFPMGDLTVSLPSGGVTLCWPLNIFRCVVFQWLPAIILDYVLQMKGKKPRLMKIQRKMYEAKNALSYFVTHNWHFHNENFIALSSFIKSEDLRAFEFKHFFRGSVILLARYILYGYRRYLLKLKDDDIEKDRRKLDKLKCITFCCKLVLFAVLFYVIFVTFDFTNFLRSKFCL